MIRIKKMTDILGHTIMIRLNLCKSRLCSLVKTWRKVFCERRVSQSFQRGQGHERSRAHFLEKKRSPSDSDVWQLRPSCAFLRSLLWVKCDDRRPALWRLRGDEVACCDLDSVLEGKTLSPHMIRAAEREKNTPGRVSFPCPCVSEEVWCLARTPKTRSWYLYEVFN